MDRVPDKQVAADFLAHTFDIHPVVVLDTLPRRLLPPVFQPDEATQTLRDYVRQRANLVRLSGQHIQRMQKALELMDRKLWPRCWATSPA